jgi:uncharacterized protein
LTERILIDTGPMVALFSKDDEHHRRCGDALAGLAIPFFTCWPVVTEAAWLLRTRPVSLYQLFGGFHSGLFSLLTLEADDLPAISALMKRYESVRLQFADAALAHLAERENLRTGFTTDRRGFSIIRLKRNRALRLIPDME